MKLRILITMIIFSITISCQKDENETEPINEIIGEWKYEYELMSDGTKNFDNPYALLEFEYSDGFILKEDGTGSSIWYDKINEDFKWEIKDSNSKLIITLIEHEGIFEYKISNLAEKTMEFESPQGHKYLMQKK